MNEPQPLTPAAALSWPRKLCAFLERDWLRVLLLLLAGFVVRLPALQGELIWDDHYLASENPFIRSPLLALEAFRHFLFLDSVSLHYRPVQNLTYIIDYYFWNTDTTGYHLSNILWHCAAGILLYLLLGKLFAQLAASWVSADDRRRRVVNGMAFISALLWTVHPAHSAAVDYISGRADSVAFVFAAGAWLLFLYGRESKQRAKMHLLFAAAIGNALLALCARETACIWLLLFLVYTLAFDRDRSARRSLIVFASCMAIAGAYFVLRHLPAERPAVPAVTQWPALMRSTLMLRALGDYARVLFAPATLQMERTVVADWSYFGNEAWRRFAGVEYLSLLGAMCVALLATATFLRGNGRRLRACGVAWFALGYLPISNLFSLNATVAEHWMYLPSVGIAMCLCGCALDLRPRCRRLALALSLVALAAFGVRSAIRSSDWVNGETFFRRTLAAGGSGRVAVNLALIYSERGEYEKAERVLRHVLKLNPDYAIARSNLATALFHLGRKDEAEALIAADAHKLPQASQVTSRGWLATFNAARMKWHDRDAAGALELTEQACREYPNTWDIVRFEAELLRETKSAEAAIPVVQQFADANWWHAGAATALGRLHAEAGDAVAAEAALRHASLLDVHDAESLNLIAQMKLRQNKLGDAFATQRRAVLRQPDEPRQYLLLSDILQKMGREDEAHAALAQVSRLEQFAHAQPSIQ